MSPLTSVFYFMIVMCSGEYIDVTLNAVEKLVMYYKDHYEELNLDGIYGLRALEGQISLLLEAYGSGRIHHLTPSWLWPQLSHLHEISHNVSELSMESLQLSDPEYYKEMQQVIEKPMKYAQDYRRLSSVLRWPSHILKKTKDGLSEEESDKCMQELTKDHCHSISQSCLSRMLQHGHSEYTLTHQLLYTMMGEQKQCVSVLDEYLQAHGISNNVATFQQHLCTNVFYEMQEILAGFHGKVLPIYQDLFMEQMFVCPVLGFMEFLHADWLNQIVSWQHPSGCYGEVVTTRIYNNHMQRRLLKEKAAGNGCLSHKTAVAASCLSQYLRYIIIPGSQEYQTYTKINGVNLLLSIPAAIGGDDQHEDGIEHNINEPPHAILQDIRLLEAAREENNKMEVLDQQNKKVFQQQQEQQGLFKDDEHVILRSQLHDTNNQIKPPQETNDIDEDENDEMHRLPDENDEEEDEDYYEENDEGRDEKDKSQKLPNVAAISNKRDDDNEEPQYIDEDKVFHEINNGKNIMNNKGAVKEVNDDAYNYDDFKDDNIASTRILASSSSSSLALNNIGLNPIGSIGSLGIIYAILVIIILVLLYCMYRFIKKKKVPTATLR